MKRVSKARQAVGMLIHKNSSARHRSLETMRYMDDGTVKVRIGGPIRGEVHTKKSRAAAVRAVNSHYDYQLWWALHQSGWKAHRTWMGASVKRIFIKYRGKRPDSF